MFVQEREVVIPRRTTSPTRRRNYTRPSARTIPLRKKTHSTRPIVSYITKRYESQPRHYSTYLASVRIWLRAVRIRFLLSSVISVTLGGAVAAYLNSALNIPDMFLVACGVVMLHASVDLLNDYRDYKRGIDDNTDRTGMSGGTGVLPEGLLRPESVYKAGVICLITGSAIGAYYIVTHGIVVGILLGFAVVSIYFYSTKIVDWGLGEIMVAIKGIMIVLGTYYTQAGTITESAILAGMAAGILSSLVLFVASFPDYKADKAGGRGGIIVRYGPESAARLYWLFPAGFFVVVCIGVLGGFFPAYCIMSLMALPLVVQGGRGLAIYHSVNDRLLFYMHRTLLYSRISGTLLVMGFVIPVIVAIYGAA